MGALCLLTQERGACVWNSGTFKGTLLACYQVGKIRRAPGVLARPGNLPPSLKGKSSGRKLVTTQARFRVFSGKRSTGWLSLLDDRCCPSALSSARTRRAAAPGRWGVCVCVGGCRLGFKRVDPQTAECPVYSPVSQIVESRKFAALKSTLHFSGIPDH